MIHQMIHEIRKQDIDTLRELDIVRKCVIVTDIMSMISVKDGRLTLDNGFYSKLS
jgi:hypothetical protein